MKKIIIILLVIAVIVGLYVALTQDNNSETPLGGDVDGTTTRSGQITEIDLSQIAFDGPYIVNISSDSGATRVAIPSMGINLCEARANISDVAALQVGDRIEVRGAVDAEGTIVPCGGEDHYLRVVE